MSTSKRDHHFGYKKVSPEEKTAEVKGVFNRVASHYDIMNDVMSMGTHRLWKQWFVNSLPLKQNGIYLDVASGTGDIAYATFERLKSFGFQAHQILTDINLAMITSGKERRPHFTWMCTNGESLPFKDNSVDVITISFGLRNVTHIELALKEFYRVLKPGGFFGCLEFSQVPPPLEKLYKFYSFHIIPKMGEWIAGDRPAYQYLSESIQKFLTRDELLKMMKQVGFERAEFETYTGGVVAFHKGYKL